MTVSNIARTATPASRSPLACDQVDPPRLAVILVAPEWAAADCQPILRRASDLGSATYKVQTLGHEHFATATDMRQTHDDIDAAAAAATLSHPEMPLVLIGHGDEASIASVTTYAEANPDRFADVVIARRHGAA